jgi:hypothetical protein
MSDPATAHRTSRIVPLGEAMSGVLVTVQMVPNTREREDRDAVLAADAAGECITPHVEPPPGAEAR